MDVTSGLHSHPAPFFCFQPFWLSYTRQLNQESSPSALLPLQTTSTPKEKKTFWPQLLAAASPIEDLNMDNSDGIPLSATSTREKILLDMGIPKRFSPVYQVNMDGGLYEKSNRLNSDHHRIDRSTFGPRHSGTTDAYKLEQSVCYWQSVASIIHGLHGSLRTFQLPFLRLEISQRWLSWPLDKTRGPFPAETPE